MNGPANRTASTHKPNMRLLSLAIACFGVGLLGVMFLNGFKWTNNSLNPAQLLPGKQENELTIKKFKNEQEFKDFLQRTQASIGVSSLSIPSLGVSEKGVSPLNATAPSQGITPQAFGTTSDQRNAISSDVTRVSQTNVQVQGIDEPDILKADDKNIYYSSEDFFYPLTYVNDVMPNAKMGIARPIGTPIQQPTAQTKIFSAFPPQNLSQKGKIEKNGNLLLSGNILVVFGNQDVTGFDISDPSKPTQTWQITLDQNNQIVASRLFNNKIYLVTRTFVNNLHPCPVEPLKMGTQILSIPCTEIYYPDVNTSSDSTYTAVSIDPKNGTVSDKISFVASSGNSTVYMSDKGLYVAYSYTADTASFVNDFFATKGKDLLPGESLQKLQKLQTYDISPQGKLSETYYIIERYRNSLSSDDQLKFDSELQNRLSSYAQDHLRDFEFTGIIKADVNNLQLSSSGQIPGRLLNQFSMDEYQNNLRVATTINANLLGGSGKSVNDTYVLDNNLKVIGSVKDLGKGEQIYAVRFIEDKGYLVTFKQTDPFFILDLSDGHNPLVKGELKLPGYSSYLDPIAKDRVLGVGQDNNQVKVSLFDVSDAENPKELDTYQLPEYWTELSNNHHAFLKDEKYKVFFLPGGRGGYIFSYDGDKLGLKKTVAGFQAKRALFINDFLYVVGDYTNSKITVLNEKDWSTVKELSL